MSEPKPNPLWVRTPPAVSKDGKTVRFDAMVLPELLELYRILGVKPAEPRSRT